MPPKPKPSKGSGHPYTYLWLVGNGGMGTIIVPLLPFFHSLLTKGRSIPNQPQTRGKIASLLQRLLGPNPRPSS